MKKLIWILGNLALVGKYFTDATSINCEPCLPNLPCPPCQTDYMADFWWYLLAWNVVIMAIFIWAKAKQKVI